MVDICKPIISSELEHDISLNLDDKTPLNIYGPHGSGKTTLVKLILKENHRVYHYIDDYSLTLENLMDNLQKITKVDVLSYFMNKVKDSIIVFDNFDSCNIKLNCLLPKLKEYKIIIISHFKYLDNSIYLKMPSRDYLIGVFLAYKILTGINLNLNDVDVDKSFFHFNNSLSLVHKSVHDIFYNDDILLLETIYKTRDLYNINYDTNNVHISYPNYCKSLKTLEKCSSILSDSLMYNNEYYNTLNNILIHNLDSPINSIQKTKINYYNRAKIIKQCKDYNCEPLELSLVKFINK
jgi:energy-coupling factor transporter ATP-binding protein EcfA2